MGKKSLACVPTYSFCSLSGKTNRILSSVTLATRSSEDLTEGTLVRTFALTIGAKTKSVS